MILYNENMVLEEVEDNLPCKCAVDSIDNNFVCAVFINGKRYYDIDTKSGGVFKLDREVDMASYVDDMNEVEIAIKRGVEDKQTRKEITASMEALSEDKDWAGYEQVKKDFEEIVLTFNYPDLPINAMLINKLRKDIPRKVGL